MHPIVFNTLILLAKSSSAPTGPEEKGLSMSWAVVLIGVIVGLLVTLSPSKRTTEFKKPED